MTEEEISKISQWSGRCYIFIMQLSVQEITSMAATLSAEKAEKLLQIYTEGKMIAKAFIKGMEALRAKKRGLD